VAEYEKNHPNVKLNQPNFLKITEIPASYKNKWDSIDLILKD
jgi:hypothetical protein